MKPDKNTFCVIMAGGIGSRFWPMSTAEHPKQFHDILGIGKSLIRMTFERILPLCLPENILVVTNSRYKSLVLEHLPELADEQVLCEPHMRNTAPCIAYSNFWISSKTDKASIVVLSADQLITNELKFIEDVRTAIHTANTHNQLVTIGIKPSSPNTGYGYIQFDEPKGSDPENVRDVVTFTEKPNLELAKNFLASGEFYWNSGIFIWNLKTIQQEFKSHLPDIFDLFEVKKAHFGTAQEEYAINEIYPKCSNISIDYGILEKSKHVKVIITDFGWSDLGTWGSVFQHLQKDENQNAVGKSQVKFIESSGNVVKISEGTQAVIQGLEGFVVVESNGKLLICKQEEQQRIKEFSKAFEK